MHKQGAIARSRGNGVNNPLSEPRAGAVRSWLGGKGIAAARLQIKGWGDAKMASKAETFQKEMGKSAKEIREQLEKFQKEAEKMEKKAREQGK